nr:hypothetical protein [Tanacetum cinerariifolium]
MVPATVLTQSKPVPITAARLVSTAGLKIKVTRPRHAKHVVTKPKSPTKRHINRSPSSKASNSPPRVTAVKALVVNVAQDMQEKWEWKPKCLILDHVSRNTSTSMTLKRFDYNDALGRSKSDKGVIDSGCSRYMTGNMSYLFDFKELNGGYVAFGSNPKGGMISRKGKFDGKVDEGFLVGYSVSSKAFKGGSDLQYVLFLVWSSGSTNPQNTNGDAAFDEKEIEFNEKKPESEVNVSLSRYRNLSAEFEDFSDNSINVVNAAGTLVPAVGQIFPNSTNTFSAGELEFITYSDDEDNVGTEADFNNLETSITVNPIPTIRVYKNHPVTQIIGDLSSATQTRSMIRVAKDQGGLSQMFNDDFHTCMFACFFHKKNPRGYIKLLKIQVRLKLYRKSYFNSRCRRNKKDKRGIVVRNKARLIVQGHTQEEGIDYKEVFALDLFKSFEKLMKDKFQMSSMGELTFFLGLQVKQKKDEIFISQDKYIARILWKFRLTDRKSASTPIDTEKPLQKDPDGEDVDVHIYKSMIGLLMYLTSPRPDIMFAECKKQAVMATSSTEAEYVAAASCCVVLSGMESLKRMLHVTNNLSAGYLTTQQMVLNSPCLTHIKN